MSVIFTKERGRVFSLLCLLLVLFLILPECGGDEAHNYHPVQIESEESIEPEESSDSEESIESEESSEPEESTESEEEESSETEENIKSEEEESSETEETIESEESSETESYGLYDENNNLLCSWSRLVSEYDLDVEKDYEESEERP